METSVQPRPAIVLVDADPDPRQLIQRLLDRRFGPDYEIVPEDSAASALARLKQLRAGRQPVTLILADQRMAGMTGIEFLAASSEMYPDAHRAVLIGAGQLNAAREAILRAAAVGEIDTYLVKPTREPDEQFYRAIAQFVEEWDREHRPQFEIIRIVGDEWDADVQRVRDTLQRSGVPCGFYPADSDHGRSLLARCGIDGPLPVVIRFDGRAIAQPTQAELAELLEVNVEPEGHEFDVAIVGAGPAGLAGAVYAASEGLDVLIVELEALGGQASTSTMIRNYLGFPRGLSGAELATRAYWQAWFFGAQFLIGHRAVGLEWDDAQRRLALDDGTVIGCGAVVIAAGVAYRRLGIESAERFVGRGVFYGVPISEAAAVTGAPVVVVGGGNSSAQSALYLSRFASKVFLVVRHPALHEMSAYLIRDIEAHRNIEVRLATELVDAVGDTRLRKVTLQNPSSSEEIDAVAVFILIGAEPRTEWLPPQVQRDERGYILTGSDLGRPVDGKREPLPLETSVPGVFAVGDVRYGGLKRIAAAVGEGSTAIRHVHEYLAEVTHQHEPPAG